MEELTLKEKRLIGKMALEPFTVLLGIIYFNKYIAGKSDRRNTSHNTVERSFQILYVLINRLVNLL